MTGDPAHLVYANRLRVCSFFSEKQATIALDEYPS